MITQANRCAARLDIGFARLPRATVAGLTLWMRFHLLCARMHGSSQKNEETNMEITERFTSADLLLMPDDGKRYEIIEGELYVSRNPGFEHQYTCSRFVHFLDRKSTRLNSSHRL